jgi:phage/plasmid-associated DNA primase
VSEDTPTTPRDPTTPTTPTPEGAPDRDAQAKVWAQQLAKRVWVDAGNPRGGRGGSGHGQVRAYLVARGIDVARLPGGVPPAVLRFHPECYDRSEEAPGTASGKKRITGPAIVAPFVSATGEVTGIHRTFLDPSGFPRKREEGLGAAKKMLGGCDGRAIRLREEYPRGALILTEGIETACACMAATGLAAWACGDAGRIARVQLPEDLVVPGGAVSTVLIAADLDSSFLHRSGVAEFIAEFEREFPEAPPGLARDIAAKATGERWALLASCRLSAAYPWLLVVARAPSGREAPRLVTVSAAGRACPVEGRKGVDWLDVYVEHGPGAVELGLVGSIDLEQAQASAAAIVRAPTPTPTPTVRPVRPVRPVPTQSTAGTRAGEPSGGEAGGGDGCGAGGGAGGGTPWIAWGGDEDELPIIESGTLERARRWLWEMMRMEGQRRFRVTRWAGSFWVYQDGRYQKFDEETVRSMLWHWLNGFRYIKRVTEEGPDIRKLTPTSRMVEDVMRALVVDTAARVVQMPSRLTAVLDDEGRPLWGRASSVEAVAGVQVQGDDASLANRVVFRNGVLDLAELAATSRVELRPHSPEVFTATCLPFDLDAARLQRLVDGGDPFAVLAEVCPNFLRWQADASEGDPDWETQYDEMLGDLLTSDRSIEGIWCYVGAKRSGKGYTEDIITALLGEDNIAAILPDQLAQDRHATAPLVGKAAAIAADAHIGRIAQNGGLVELFKIISGRGRIPVRDLYQPGMTVKLSCRIILFMNAEPSLTDDSTALAGRLVFLPFRKSAAHAPDERIKNSVGVEAAGIMLKAIMGALRLARKPRRCIDLCQEAAEMAGDFERFSAHIKAFVDDWLVRDETVEDKDSATQDDVYTNYCAWCHLVAERKPKGKGRFFQDVKFHLPKTCQPRQDNGERPRVYPGVRIRSDKAQVARGWAARQAEKGKSFEGFRP